MCAPNRHTLTLLLVLAKTRENSVKFGRSATLTGYKMQKDT